jgi:hypothetical protein
MLATLGPEERGRQRVLTAWITWEIERKDVERAHAAYARLVEEFEGEGVLASGDRLGRSTVAAALAEAALEEARQRGEGSEGDRARAASALEVATALVPDAKDPEVEANHAATKTWLEAAKVDDLLPEPSPHAGPRVVVFADDFWLGEPVPLSVLRRWAAAGVRVGVVPLVRGTVREGMRRVPQPSAEVEVARIVARLADGPAVREPGAYRVRTAREHAGLPSGWNGAVVADARGTVVARVSGITPDLSRLDAAVERVAGR